MTDKVQKIREAVEKRYECWKEKESNSHSIESEIRMSECQHLLLMLNSLQEDTVSKVWHDASEEPKPNMELICVGQYGNPLVLSSNSNSFKSRDISKWAYFNDLINLSNVEKTVKNWNEPVSEDFETALADEWVGYVNRGASMVDALEDNAQELAFSKGFYRGAKWQKEHLWKSADGEDLPEYDRDVIVLTQPYPLENSEYAVSFAHRPNHDGWDGKSLLTGKVEHYTPKTYDKGGWNIPNVKYWLDCNMDSIFKRNNENSKINKR